MTESCKEVCVELRVDTWLNKATKPTHCQLTVLWVVNKLLIISFVDPFLHRRRSWESCSHCFAQCKGTAPFGHLLFSCWMPYQRTHHRSRQCIERKGCAPDRRIHCNSGSKLSEQKVHLSALLWCKSNNCRIEQCTRHLFALVSSLQGHLALTLSYPRWCC